MNELKPGLYRHFKGHDVRVYFVAKHSETEELMVVYEHLGDNPKSKYWVRPLAMFIEQVDRDGYSGPRFTFLED